MPIRILLVDDHAVVRQGLKMFLGLDPDLEVIGEAQDGAEALRLAHELLPDVVLMDLLMPVMDGITAMREIRRRPEWKRLPVIMLTAKAMPDDQENCLAAGANDYMAKPLDVDKLLSLVRVWMPR